MYLTVHLASGIFIGQRVQSIFLAFLLGVLAHFLLDFIPHGDSEIFQRKSLGFYFKVVSIDGLFSLSYLFILFKFIPDFVNSLNFIPVLAAVIGAFLPDVCWGLYLLFGGRFLKKYKEFHHAFHLCQPVKVKRRLGIIIQIGFVILFTLGLFYSF